jgi:hypothetical protein
MTKFIWDEERINQLSESELATLIENSKSKKNDELTARLEARMSAGFGASKKASRSTSGGASGNASGRSPCVELTPRLAMLACLAAFNERTLGEGAVAKETKELSSFDEDFTKKWLAYWMLSRTVSLENRSKLASFMTNVIRPLILSTPDTHAKLAVAGLAKRAKSEGGAKGVATSLVSKFAFSLKPEVYAIYDRRARDAMAFLYGVRIPEHDYVTYFETFHNFVLKFKVYLVDNDLLAKVEPIYKTKPDVISENLFFLRAADKALMLIGGFNPKTMEKGIESDKVLSKIYLDTIVLFATAQSL